MVLVHPAGPYDLALSLKVAGAFSPGPSEAVSALRAPARVRETPVIVEVRQTQIEPPVLRVSSPQRVGRDRLEALAEWITLAELDLSPFYALCEGHPLLRRLTRLLHGLKHFRPASVFEMAVIAITEHTGEAGQALRAGGGRRLGFP